MRREGPRAARERDIGQNVDVTQTLDRGEEDRMVVVPLEAIVLAGHCAGFNLEQKKLLRPNFIED